jgi:hypothetical protein
LRLHNFIPITMGLFLQGDLFFKKCFQDVLLRTERSSNQDASA